VVVGQGRADEKKKPSLQGTEGESKKSRDLRATRGRQRQNQRTTSPMQSRYMKIGRKKGASGRPIQRHEAFIDGRSEGRGYISLA